MNEIINLPPLSTTLQILLLMTALTLLPAALLMMTAFTRIAIVLAILRQALGLGQSPPNQLLVGTALLLTLFVMKPQFDRIHDGAWTPMLAGKLPAEQALARTGAELKTFMLGQTRSRDLTRFAEIAGGGPYARPADVPLVVVMPAFVASELKTALEIGLVIYLPFLIIDLIVASVLMAMGMMMVSPATVSLPLKIALFVVVDGWTLVLGALAKSFGSA
ncbi:flagellar biosynthetic protein FliP [Sandarakinorhabdus cyanobacteriorum]|uniref:Flagellar biosynthetic protein FliP n=1 Tax=Sandarakinorhabdus cyanobacteriorum TaxID=1981098 RepID=A0A255YPP6_9SPHN|nr:flagellar type III secretion system pore protein FliP [Sandarakinorhabdus cyanobacteriorum]OYQ31171.1 flagellar biosynthetic protein FliP [Sandarakinorhabdus cyanobacteriorum]